MKINSVELRKIKLSKDEIPLKEDSSNFFLEIMIAISIFIFAITLSGVLSINTMLSSWSTSILSSVTVQIMPVNNINNQKAIEETLIQQKNAIKFLSTVQGIEKVEALNDEQLQKLLKPWLGEDFSLSDLPIPRLIDVKINPNAHINFEEIAEQLIKVAPKATIDSHRLWLAKLVEFAGGLRNLAILILLLVLTIVSLGIIYVTKSSLGIHKKVIEVLHIMGAKDSYIAKQFARRTGLIAFIGGSVGIMCAIPTIFVIAKTAEKIEGGIISEIDLSVLSWLAILSLPLFALALAMMTAYVTVKRTLSKLM